MPRYNSWVFYAHINKFGSYLRTIYICTKSTTKMVHASLFTGIYTTEGLSDPPNTNYDKIDKYLLENGYVPKP